MYQNGEADIPDDLMAAIEATVRGLEINNEFVPLKNSVGPERKRCLVSTSGSAKKVRLSRRYEHEASLLGEENSDPYTSPAKNMQANPLKSGDLRDLATYLSVPRLWTKLTTPDLDLLVYVTTRTTKQPFSVSHEKVICFSLDSNSDVVASCYFGAREKKYGKITSLLEATNIFQEVDTALLCSSAMSKDAYDGLAQNLTEKMKRTLTPASDGVFSKNCLGMVTVKAANRVSRAAYSPSTSSSSYESSSSSQEGSPDYDSPRPVSPRASRSCDPVNAISAKVSPPPVWYGNPGVHSPTLSAPDVRNKRTDNEVGRWLLPASAVPATCSPRAKTPFRVTSADKLRGQQQQQIQLAAAGAGEAQHMERTSSH
ncbi:hypothetical protein MRX96_028500 [Rhipicephalus microplus]